MRQSFDRDGVVRITGAIADAEVGPMRDRARAGIAAVDFVEVAGARRPAPGAALALWEIGRAPELAPLPAALARAVDELFGPGVWTQAPTELGGLAIPNLPCPSARWSASEVSWHVDEPSVPGASSSQALIAYALLDRLEPGGGATVVAAGSHRRLGALAEERGAPIGFDEACALVRADPGLVERAVELIGEAGDLLLLDPRCLHTISANVSPRPRLAMRLTCLRI